MNLVRQSRPPMPAGRRFWRDTSATSAIEFAAVAAPFIMFLMGILQVGVYYMAQSAMDAAVVKSADSLRTTFTTGTNPTLPTSATLKSSVASNSGGMVRNNSALAVEIRPLAGLSAAAVPITDGVADYGSATSTLVLRAQAPVPTFAPGFTVLTQVKSSAIVRRQGH